METAIAVDLMINETLQTIYQRRSVRKYKTDSVSTELIEQIIDAGRMAPSAINKQPWRFYVLTKKVLILSFSLEIEKVAEESLHLAHGIDTTVNDDFIFHDAPVVIFITAPEDNEWAPLDVGMCSENIMLAAKSLGLDTCPIGLAKFVDQTKIFSKLNIPSTEKVLLAIILGYGDEDAVVKERRKNNVVYID